MPRRPAPLDPAPTRKLRLAFAELRRGRAAVAFATGLTLLLPGCLGPSYVIPKDEIRRLAKVEPARRGNHVRVVQRFSTADEPPAAEAWPAPPPNRPGRAAEAHPDGDLNGAAWWWWWGPPGRPIVSPRFGVSSRSGVVATGTPPGAVVPNRARPDGVGTRALSRATSTSSSGSDLGKAVALVAVAAAVVGVGLAVSEGSRYDGWVAVHPAHPVHVVASRRHRVVPLWQLADEPIAEDEEAILVRHEGAGMWLRGRAPLDRTGFSYGFDASRQLLALDQNTSAALGGSTVQIGFWPVWWAGVEVGAMMGWGSDGMGLAVSRFQPRIELELMPLRLWRFHLGGLVAWGLDVVARDLRGADRSDMVSTAGAMLQFDLTTRLALTARWQWTLHHGGGLPGSSAFGLGLSVY